MIDKELKDFLEKGIKLFEDSDKYNEETKMLMEGDALIYFRKALALVNLHQNSINKYLKRLLLDLVDNTPCKFDHHGYCQSHSWLEDSDCPQKRLRNVLGITLETPKE